MEPAGEFQADPQTVLPRDDEPNLPVVWTGTEAVLIGTVATLPIKAQAPVVGVVPIFNPTTGAWRLGAAPSMELNGTMLGQFNGADVEVFDLSPRTLRNIYLPDPIGPRAASYNLAANRWASPSEDRPPAIGRIVAAVWTGSQFLAWSADARFGSYAAAYDPRSGGWTVLSTAAGPFTDSNPLSAWTGSEMIVVSTQGRPAGAFNPLTRTWRDLPDSLLAAPTSMAWTGTEVVVFDAVNGQLERFRPDDGRWSSGAPAPFTSPGVGAAPIWTGSLMVIWGGPRPGDGKRVAVVGYEPATNNWRPLPDLPDIGLDHALWLGDRLMLWQTTVTSDQSQRTIRVRATTLMP